MTAMLAVIVWLYQRHAPACFFGAFFFVALLPTSNLLLIIGSIMAERFLYLPSIGFAGCVVAGVLALVRKTGRRGFSSASGWRPRRSHLLLLDSAMRSWSRNSDWADSERFWMSALETSPNSFKTRMAPIYGWSQKGFTWEISTGPLIRQSRPWPSSAASSGKEHLDPLGDAGNVVPDQG